MRKSIIILCAGLLLVVLAAAKFTNKGKRTVSNQVPADPFVCTPCGSECDTIELNAPGTCAHCSMALVKKSTISHSDIEPEDLCSFINKKGQKNVVLLDVRTPEEYDGKAEVKFGRLNHAINIPIQELEKRIDELAPYKNKNVVVYCSHSHRSPRASYMLSQHGFAKVTNMAGGMSVWKSQVKENDPCNKSLYVAQ